MCFNWQISIEFLFQEFNLTCLAREVIIFCTLVQIKMNKFFHISAKPAYLCTMKLVYYVHELEPYKTTLSQSLEKQRAIFYLRAKNIKKEKKKLNFYQENID